MQLYLIYHKGGGVESELKLENFGRNLLSEDDHSYLGAAILEYNEGNFFFG